MNVDKYIAIAEKQEELLQFPHFNRQDAWDLGQLLVKRILERRLVLVCSIRLLNGFILFQYAGEGTKNENEFWLSRKFNTVRDLDASSLLNAMRLLKKKQTLESRGLDPSKYVNAGGGFPIRIKDTGLAGVALVSGLPHLQDHDFLIDSLGEYLKADRVPRIPVTLKL
jgi:uncharacterized protein (UPF0303 family)